MPGDLLVRSLLPLHINECLFLYGDGRWRCESCLPRFVSVVHLHVTENVCSAEAMVAAVVGTEQVMAWGCG